MAGQWKPLPDHTYLWNNALTTYAGGPVVTSTTADTVTNPAGTAADLFVGIAQEDAGPLAPAQAVNAVTIPVQIFGTAKCYGKGTITAGQMVKVGPTISTTPYGYVNAITVYTVQSATQTAAGSQPFPIVGRAKNSTSADGDIVYVDLLPGVTY